jgi:hydrogenase maturation protease
MRVLIAGVGNVLRGDDGFGVEVLRRLEQGLGGTPGVHFYESGIAGIGLVQQLVDGYDALVVLDALDRGAAPGTVFVLQPDVAALAAPGRLRQPIDPHQAGPEGVFRLAAALGVLPPRVWLVGCQAAACDDLGSALSDPVCRAIPAALQRVYDILATIRTDASEAHGPV